ncbi:MAG TPA: hypothetical protein VLS93_12970 [Anaeromyxobacteraceae bacterium]|nr:hypothetical protein [Anaeromyxobacteraceae bacterium]
MSRGTPLSGAARERAAGAVRESVAAAGRAFRASWSRRPSRSTAGALALAAVVVAAGTSSILFQAGLPRRLPSGLHWKAAAALLSRDGQPGDAAIVSPHWAERARSALPASVPVLPLRRVTGDDLVGVRRVWLVSLPDAPGPSTGVASELAARSVKVDDPQRLGALEVALFTIAAPTLPLAYLPDRLAGAEVRLGEQACAADASGAFRCQDQAVVRVAREVREMDSTARPCLLAAPDPAAGEALVVTFPAVPVGRALRGHAAAVGPRGGAVRLVARLDGEEVGTIEVAGGPGWRAFQLDTTRFAGSLRQVSFAIAGTSPEAPPVCLEAMTLP